MECFVAVAENLSFARAAEQLHVTQPAVTQQIHALEKELNVRLLNRSTRSVKLTEEGKIFLQDAKQVVEVSERARKRFENPDSRKIRPLTLGCYSFAGLFQLSDILKKLSELYPDLHPRLQMTPARHLYRQLEEGDMDAVIGFREAETIKVPAVYQEMKKIRIVCICEKGHRFAGRESVSAQEGRKAGSIHAYPASGLDGADAGQAGGRKTPSGVVFLRIGGSGSHSGAGRIWYLCDAGTVRSVECAAASDSHGGNGSHILWHLLPQPAGE